MKNSEQHEINPQILSNCFNIFKYISKFVETIRKDLVELTEVDLV